MIQVRIVCGTCQKITPFSPGVTNEMVIEPMNCIVCGHYIGEVVYLPDKAISKT
jgi:hypothetical protein